MLFFGAWPAERLIGKFLVKCICRTQYDVHHVKNSREFGLCDQGDPTGA